MLLPKLIKFLQGYSSEKKNLKKKKVVRTEMVIVTEEKTFYKIIKKKIAKINTTNYCAAKRKFST